MTFPHAVYCDGGCILGNPSYEGGTWAYCWVDRTYAMIEDRFGSGVLTLELAGNICDVDRITNNLTEMYALFLAIGELPAGWSGEVCSDSQITLDRVFGKYKKWNGIPDVLQVVTMARVARLGAVTPVLLDGHPTKAHILAGVGRHGHPVSPFQVWCDKACSEQAKRYIEAKYGKTLKGRE